MKTRATFQILFVLLLPFSLPACSLAGSPPPALRPITVQLSFSHQAEFAGLYAADQQGYYAQEGLAVSFVEGGPEVDSITPVANGSAQFGVAQPADVILARADGKPVRAVAVIYRHSPIVFFALADSGITRPQDFVRRAIRSTLTVDQTLLAMMSNVGIPPDQYEVVYLPSELSQFLSSKVPVWSGFLNIFALEVQRAGYAINIIYPDDYGIHFYGDVLITTDNLIANDPDLVLKFTRATLKGWTFAVEHPETAGSLVQNYNPDADAALEVARMTTSIPFVNTGEDFIGWMRPEIWEAMEQTLREQDVLKNALNVDQIYTLQFLEEIYNR